MFCRNGDDSFHAQAAPARGVGHGTRQAGQGKFAVGFYHSHRPRKQRTRASEKKPTAASEDNDEHPPQASPTIQFRKKQMRDRNFADARASHTVFVPEEGLLMFDRPLHRCVSHADDEAPHDDEGHGTVASVAGISPDECVSAHKRCSGEADILDSCSDDAADSRAFDITSAPTMPEADLVGEVAMPEVLLHKACWTFIRMFRLACSVSNRVVLQILIVMHKQMNTWILLRCWRRKRWASCAQRVQLTQKLWRALQARASWSALCVAYHSSQLSKRSAMCALLLPPTRSSNGLRQKGLWSLKKPRLIRKVAVNLLRMRLACFPVNRLVVLSLPH